MIAQLVLVFASVCTIRVAPSRRELSTVLDVNEQGTIDQSSQKCNTLEDTKCLLGPGKVLCPPFSHCERQWTKGTGRCHCDPGYCMENGQCVKLVDVVVTVQKPASGKEIVRLVYNDLGPDTTLNEIKNYIKEFDQLKEWMIPGVDLELKYKAKTGLLIIRNDGSLKSARKRFIQDEENEPEIVATVVRLKPKHIKSVDSSTPGEVKLSVKKIKPGWGTNDEHGSSFDDWQFDGYAGAITKICYWEGKADWFTWRSIIGFQVWYAGKEGRYHGGQTRDTKACIDVSSNEVIYRIKGKESSGENGLMDVVFCTKDATTNVHIRCSKQIGEVSKGAPSFDYEAPHGDHIMSFWGLASGKWGGWDGNIEKIGVYVGHGGGRGDWIVESSFMNTVSGTQFTYMIGSKEENTVSKELTSEWSQSVRTEMSTGFSIEGIAEGGMSTSLESTFSHEIVDTTQQAFQTEQSRSIDFGCRNNYRLWVWTYTSKFAGHAVTSKSPAGVCWPSRPCCLPKAYSDSPDVCDLRPNDPYLCQE